MGAIQSMKCAGVCDHKDDSQQFPDRTLFHNLNVPPDRLEEIADLESRGEVYAYVVRTVKWDVKKQGHIIQTGSAPNFARGCITLCTCKHQMRSRKKASDWRGHWIAGFTSRSKNNPHRLIYLMRVKQAFESHYELWHALTRNTRIAKSMARDPFGDIIEPRFDWDGRDRRELFDPRKYARPNPKHSHKKTWKIDLDYRVKKTLKRRVRIAPSLLGAAARSFLWPVPTLALKIKLPRDFKKFHSLGNFLQNLKS